MYTRCFTKLYVNIINEMIHLYPILQEIDLYKLSHLEQDKMNGIQWISFI